VRPTRVLHLSALASLSLAVGPGLAGASEYRVSGGLDTPPNGCTPGACTLREAVLAANSAPGADVVVLAPKRAYGLTIAGAGEDGGLTGDLDVTGPLALLANGRGRATIDAQGIDRALDLHAPVTLEGLRITGGGAGDGGGDLTGAGVRVMAGRLTLRDSALIGNRGASALELVGDEGMTARDSAISGNSATGLVDRGGGGVRIAHTEVSANQGSGLVGYGDGSLGVWHAELAANALRGVQEFGPGDIAAVDATIRGNGFQALDEHDEGSVYVRRSRLRGNGADAVAEADDGELSVHRTRITGSGGGAASELGVGSVSMIKARLSFNDGLGISEAEKGSVGLEESLLVGSPLGGVLEQGEGDVVLTLADVVDSGGTGVSERDDGDVALVRAAVTGADAQALVANGGVSLLQSRLAGNGGGIVVAGGTLALGRSQVVENAGEFGGVWALNSRVTLRQSTIGHNVAGGEQGGGGIALLGTSEVDALNVTIAENSAQGPGGGVLIGPDAEAQLNAVTVSGNASGAGGGGVSLAAGATARIDNSLIAGNRAELGGADCDGAGFDSGGGNLVGSHAGCEEFGGPADLIRANAKTGPLRDNGGLTPTVALLRGSPAIGAAGPDAPRRDQRNRSRRDPDAGAFERG
jgi:hypothetical protein